MKLIAFVLIVLSIFAILILYWGVRFGVAAYVSLGLVKKAVPYENVSNDPSVPMLVLGDSTAVGVGADTPKDSLAARVAEYVGATYTENYAKSGAVVADVPGQIAQAKLPHYRLILLQIGANDIIQRQSAEKTVAKLGPVLDTLPKADQVIFITSGNVGGATIMPPPIRPYYTRLNLQYHAAFAMLAAVKGITYVNLYVSPKEDPFEKQPEVYLAPDGLHPSSRGYELWFETIKPFIIRS